jgi:hypothetical protein
VDFTCQDSGFGNCCGSNNTCGHDANHCGTRRIHLIILYFELPIPVPGRWLILSVPAS